MLRMEEKEQNQQVEQDKNQETHQQKEEDPRDYSFEEGKACANSDCHCEHKAEGQTEEKECCEEKKECCSQGECCQETENEEETEKCCSHEGCGSHEEMSVEDIANSADDKVDALIDLLVKKDIITEPEFSEALEDLYEEESDSSNRKEE